MFNLAIESKTCPACNKSFPAKRLNHIYCSVKCRSLKNNRLAKIKADETKNLDKKLHNNRSILKKIYEKNIGEVSTDYLMGAGFDLSLFTSTIEYKSTRYNLCFEFGITELIKDKFKIVKFNNN